MVDQGMVDQIEGACETCEGAGYVAVGMAGASVPCSDCGGKRVPLLFTALFKAGNGFDIVDEERAEQLVREYGVEIRTAARSDAETLRAYLDAGLPSGGNFYHYTVRSFAAAEALAALMGGGYAAADAGPHVSPRFTVFRLPAVGDPVSYAFNGDYYPDGQIVKVGTGPKAKITTSTGSVYYRRKLSASWTKPGGTWALVHGHHDRRNPHF